MKAIFSLKDLETLLTPEAAKRVGVNSSDPIQVPVLVRASVDTLSSDSEACVVLDVELNEEAAKAVTVSASKVEKRKKARK
jgi:hypothetical protein